MGCGGGNDGPPRVAVEGSVTFGGAPLGQGSILFVPIEGTQGPQVGGRIEEGSYAIPEDQGPVVGRHRVEIRAEQQLGFDLADPEAYAQHAGEPLPANPIPARYNEQSELTAETRLNADNTFDFHLQPSVSAN